MGVLNKVVSYWYNCIKREDELGEGVLIGPNAALCPFNIDTFIFRRKDEAVLIPEESPCQQLLNNAETNRLDVYYGYPVLLYVDGQARQCLAPLFTIKVRSECQNGQWYVQRDEPFASCGSRALEKLGIPDEQVMHLGQEVEAVFVGELGDTVTLMERCLNVLKAEVDLPFAEDIAPVSLTNNEILRPGVRPGLYNKSLLMTGESTAYNAALLRDLYELMKQKDLEKTSLGFILDCEEGGSGSVEAPVLPFPCNEYQTAALSDILNNRLTVITGPPGTGKSQYIANVLINLFVRGKSVLLVSHTNKAVDVVYEKINEQFQNLMLRTGKKPYRKELVASFDELLEQCRRRNTQGPRLRDIERFWRLIMLSRLKLIKIDKLEQQVSITLKAIEFERCIVPHTGQWRRRLFWAKHLPSLIRLKMLRKRLAWHDDRIALERAIRESEVKYNEQCRDLVRSLYVKKLASSGYIGRVRSFLSDVGQQGMNEDVDGISFERFVQEILRVWGSPLKPIRKTFPLKGRLFDYVIFDEASQVDLPSAAPALYRAERAVIVGDPMQLPHIAKLSHDVDKSIAEDCGILQEAGLYKKVKYRDVSLYKTAEKCFLHSFSKPPVQLKNHYRSEDEIAALCNECFYKGELKVRSKLDWVRYPKDLPRGIHWKHCPGETLRSGKSKVNHAEVNIVMIELERLLNKIKDTELSVGIVTPYKAQVKALADRIDTQKEANRELYEGHSVEVDTAHKFQGSEKDIMIASIVIAGRGDSNDSWYREPQILNVALSRARYYLVIVGDKEYCNTRVGTLGDIAKKYDEIKTREVDPLNDAQRRHETPEERLLFDRLQRTDIGARGYTITSQRWVKRYRLDIAIEESGPTRLDVECDGHQHEIVGGLPVIEDVERDQFLRNEGWEVVRFPNYQILLDPDDVVQKILQFLLHKEL